ncbi:DUF4350 domain-containing protein [Nesterenkonia lutea]|uniref:DUF4350 domain-containing protein n=1 Tax=Nesterenkonia lutea TaxID=272919 RepID=A0ABR9JF15_9MICC|nr:DUF4350 domain-containing protein [Nesterenkonia lutea]MBE1524521.1 hypothetical protein [Nesterenkonia lutea]
MTTTATLGSALRSGFQRWQFWLLLLVLGLLSVVLVQAMSEEDTDRYGLENTSLDGYAALAQVLQDEGVTLRTASSAQVAEELMQEHPEAPLVVLSTGEVPAQGFLDQLREGADREVVLLTESPELVDALYPEGEVSYAGAHAGGGPLEAATLDAGAQCAVPAAVNAGQVQAPGALFHSHDPGCFTGFEDDSGQAQILVETSAGVLFGSPEAFSNHDITSAGHAALALWLFGGRDELIWYTPMGLDAMSSEDWASPTDLLPGWVVPLAWWLLLCAVVLMLVMGRRPGPVVGEPLPVQVPAAETAEGRGRMYQSANAVQASAQTLRSAHLIRLSRLLRLGSAPQQSGIVEAVARQVHRDPAEIARLFAEQPRSNAELVAHAQALKMLEDDAQHAVLTQHTRTGSGSARSHPPSTPDSPPHPRPASPPHPRPASQPHPRPASQPHTQQGKNTSND